MARKSVHVTYRKNDGKWHISNGSSSSSTSEGSYKTQKEAMQILDQKAQKGEVSTEVVNSLKSVIVNSLAA